VKHATTHVGAQQSGASTAIHGRAQRRNTLLGLQAFGQCRGLLTMGEFRRLVADDGLRGVTSIPSIFERAIRGEHGLLHRAARDRRAPRSRADGAPRDSSDSRYPRGGRHPAHRLRRDRPRRAAVDTRFAGSITFRRISMPRYLKYRLRSTPTSSSRKTGSVDGSSRCPCCELFDAQPQSYRDAVLPPSVRAGVSIEVASHSAGSATLPRRAR